LKLFTIIAHYNSKAMKKIAILGAGRIGSTIAKDLATEYDVTAFDINPDNLAKLPPIIEKKTTEINYNEFDLVVTAVPGHVGYLTLKGIIQSGTNVVDISFFPQNPFELDNLAKKNGVTAIVDCGVAPGLSNILVGYYDYLVKAQSIKIYVGGLPVKKTGWLEYKTVFSPRDVLEEYIRPARMRVDGKTLEKEALTDTEIIDFSIGPLEAFNTDGSRTLLETIDAPNIVEKTLRYPGHRDKISGLREMGFLDKKVITRCYSPFNLTTKILTESCNLGDEQDVTILRVIVEGSKNYYQADLVDYGDEENTSMARTTGFTAAIVARMVVEGKFVKNGIIPPEILGRNPVLVGNLKDSLKERNISIEESSRAWTL